MLHNTDKAPVASLRLRAWLAAATVAATVAAGAAWAQSSQTRMPGLQLSGNQPIQIGSDRLEIRQNDNVAILSGNVTV